MGGMYQMLKFAKPHGLKLGLCYVCTCFCSVLIWYQYGIKTSQTCVQVILEKESSRLGIHRESRENLQFVPCMAAVRTFQRSQMCWRATCTNGWQLRQLYDYRYMITTLQESSQSSAAEGSNPLASKVMMQFSKHARAEEDIEKDE